MVDVGSLEAAPAPVSPEIEIARDLARRAVPVGLVLVALSAAIWGVDGALTSALAVAIIVANFVVAAALMGWAARISTEALMIAVLGGFIVRMGVIAVAVWAVKDEPWVVLPVLAFTLLAAQLVLLFWETKYVSGSLAFPGLKPKPAKEAHRP
ncbi:MAG: ATP synthase subunit I [Acidimicrobiales bacterium]